MKEKMENQKSNLSFQAESKFEELNEKIFSLSSINMDLSVNLIFALFV
jgi:hypothetical protein